MISALSRSLLSMSMSDDVFHSVCHLKASKEIWDTLRIQYEGTDSLFESRKINLVRQYEMFISTKGETLSQVHQRFSCLLIDLKAVGTIYTNSEVVTKFMEALPESWSNLTMCLKFSKDMKTLTLSGLYGIMLNHEQSIQLKKNLIRDAKDSKSTFVALVSESLPSATHTFSVVITELDDTNFEDLSDADFDESLALLTNTFRRFARKSNFQKKKPFAITDKPKSIPVDKASAICYNSQGKGHFASDCSYKKNRFLSSSQLSFHQKMISN